MVNRLKKVENNILMYAAGHNDVSMAWTAIKAGAEVDLHSELAYRDLPLHSACSRNHEPMVELLLAAGANPFGMVLDASRRPVHAWDLTDNDNIITMLEAAEKNKRPVLEDVLEKHKIPYVQDEIAYVASRNMDVNTRQGQGVKMQPVVKVGKVEDSSMSSPSFAEKIEKEREESPYSRREIETALEELSRPVPLKPKYPHPYAAKPKGR
jgi:ankyrin repeat protein